MKFNCDKVKQRNKRKLEEFWDVHANKWVEEFAWWPVRVAEGDCRWLENVEAMWVPKERCLVEGYYWEKRIFLDSYKHGVDFDREVRRWGIWKYRPLGESSNG